MAAPLSTLDLLCRARKKLEKPEAWIQGSMAWSAKSVEVKAHSRLAVAWCVQGALMGCTPATTKVCPYLSSALRIIEACLPPEAHTLISWNDESGRTHTEVLDLFDRAIKRAEYV